VKEEVKRIIKLVQEGKLSAEDAADLIDAFNVGEPTERVEATAEAQAEGTAETTDIPPPPPPGNPRDPFRAVVEAMEKIGREVSESVNWTEVAQQARTSASKGFEALKTGVEQVSKGKIDIGWFSSRETKDVTLPLNVPAGRVLRIENPCGDIKVVGGFDEGSVTAHARFSANTIEDARAKAQEYTLIIEESDHQVLIRQPDVSGLSVDLEIQLPGQATVEIRSESGDVSILDTKGGARISTRSGDIKLRGLNGPIEVNVTSGDLTVEDTVTPSLVIENKSGDIVLRRIDGNVNARTASGDVRMDASKGKTIAIETVSGDVRVDVDEPVTGVLNVRTVNGDAYIAVPDGSDCRVALSTLRGSVSSLIELQDATKSDQQIKGRLGDGNGTLDVSAVTGDIALEMHIQA
jgi:DUF4097 and DUF4098 domain-containing protein YvlB